MCVTRWSGHRSIEQASISCQFIYLYSALFDISQFTQFARTVGDAAVDQQRRMRQTFVDFGNHISSTAIDVNTTWPMFRVPYFELHSGQVRLQSGMEYIYCSYFIYPEDAEDYLEFVTANYKDSVNEGHMTLYGNLDRLNATGYTPYFKIFGPNGTVEDTTEKPIRSGMWQISPRKCFVYRTG